MAAIPLETIRDPTLRRMFNRTVNEIDLTAVQPGAAMVWFQVDTSGNPVNVPAGYIGLIGQTLSVPAYPVLYSIFGNKYGGTPNQNFVTPDTRMTLSSSGASLGGSGWQSYACQLQNAAGVAQTAAVSVSGYWTQSGQTILCRIICQPSSAGGVYAGVWYFTLPKACNDTPTSADLGSAFAWLEAVALNILDPAGSTVLGVSRIRGDDLSRVSAWVTSGTANIVQVAGNAPLDYTAAFTSGRLELTFSYPANNELGGGTTTSVSSQSVLIVRAA